MRVDGVVIGGGFYGSMLALHLRRHLDDVLVLERDGALLSRASYVNQARLHNGYHYPRSFQTATRSHRNVAIFRSDFPDAVVDDFKAYYCVAAQNSKVSSGHFTRFCRRVGMPLSRAPREVSRLFEHRLVDNVYEVTEAAFNATVVAEILQFRLDKAHVNVLLGAKVIQVHAGTDECTVVLNSGREIRTKWVFNTTYAGLNSITGVSPQPPGTLRHQVVEIALIEPPEQLAHIACTIIDGPFFGIMPFPARGLTSLYHVRYSPHFQWVDRGVDSPNPYEVLGGYDCDSSFPYMIRDAARYVPLIAQSQHADSLFDVRTLLANTIQDDARPILVSRSEECPRVLSLLGGKIDNIYDLLVYLEEDLEGQWQ